MRAKSFCLGIVALSAGLASAGEIFFQGFETDTSGWIPLSSPVTRVASGTGGVSSSSGSYHATVGGGSPTGAFTRFGEYRYSFDGGFVASIDVFLDPAWASGTGFDYSVAASKQDGSHLRDFIFHVTKDTSTGKLLVAGTNNSNGAPREDLETINHHEVTAAGWYALQSVFYDNGGVLAVDLNLVDSGGNILFTETRSNPADLIASVVGGNRYGWFTHITGTTIAIDDTSLTLSVVPLPSAAGLAGIGLLGVGARRRRAAL